MICRKYLPTTIAAVTLWATQSIGALAQPFTIELTQLAPTADAPGSICRDCVPHARRGGQETNQRDPRGKISALIKSDDECILIEAARFRSLAGYFSSLTIADWDSRNVNPIDTWSCQPGPGDVSARTHSVFHIPPIGAATGIRPTRDLDSLQSYEFGQGTHCGRRGSNKTTALGPDYQQFIPVDEMAQQAHQLALPTVIETNF
jgi:hypothetical protein